MVDGGGIGTGSWVGCGPAAPVGDARSGSGSELEGVARLLDDAVGVVLVLAPGVPKDQPAVDLQLVLARPVALERRRVQVVLAAVELEADLLGWVGQVEAPDQPSAF